MGKVVQLKRRKPKERSRRVSVTLTGEFLARAEAAAKEMGVAVQDVMRLGLAGLLDRYEALGRAARPSQADDKPTAQPGQA